MSFGKMNLFVNIVSTETEIDSAGFSSVVDKVLASVRAYREERHGTAIWANRAAFSEATCLFRFRRIPRLTVTPEMYLVCMDGRYRILSVEDVRGKGMYIECLAEKVSASKQ
jgi:hypothetical protein